MKRLLTLLPVFLLVLVVGCFEEDSPNQPNDAPPTPVNLAEITGPSSAGVPSEVTSQVSSMNTISGFWRNMFSWTSAVNSEKVGDTFTWTKTVNQLTITATSTYIGNDEAEWVVILNGSQKGQSFDHWTAVTGTASIDGTSGSLDFYNINTTEVAYRYSWSTDSDGNRTVTFEDLSASEKIVVVNNIDGSGSLEKYDNEVLIFEATWDANGAGSWIKYDAEGNELDSGSWTDLGPPTIPQAISLTGANSNYAPEWIKGRITAMNSLFAAGNNWFSMASQFTPTLKDTTFVWNNTSNQLTVTIEANYADDGSVEWTVMLDGTDGEDTYNNWIAMRGNSSANGKSASFEFYLENSTDIEFRYSWSIDDQGNKTVTFEDIEDGEKWVVVNNVDDSGSFTEYENGVKVFEAVWNADGSGSWVEYDENGNIKDSGSWS